MAASLSRVASLCAQAVAEGPYSAWIFVKLRLECEGEIRGLVRQFGDFIWSGCALCTMLCHSSILGTERQKGSVGENSFHMQSD